MGNVARRSGRRYVNGVPIVCIPLTVRSFGEKGKSRASDAYQHERIVHRTDTDRVDADAA
jgi:hypothetical protein